MATPEEGSSEVKHSFDARIANEYAKLSEADNETMAQHRQEMTDRAVADPTHGEQNQMVIEEGERRRTALHEARESLRQIEAGEVQPEDKHAAWEAAMTRVDEAKMNMHEFADSNPVRYDVEVEAAAGSTKFVATEGKVIMHDADGEQRVVPETHPETHTTVVEHGRGTETEVRHISTKTVEDGPAPHGTEEERQEARAVVEGDRRGLQGRRTREAIGKVEIERPLWGMDDDPASAKYRPLAQEVVARAIADKEFADDLIKRAGTDYSDRGISEAMAVAALPYIEQADRAAMQGRPKRAEILRQAASDLANGIARGMEWENSFRRLHEAGAEPSLNGVRYKPSKRPPNALKSRNLFQRMGVSWKALRARD